MKTKTFNVHRLAVKRGLDVIVHEYNDIEIAVLARSHLPENLEIQERDVGTIDLPDDANQVHAQLVRKFDTINNPVVGKVFPAAATLAQHFGLSMGATQIGILAETVKKSRQSDPAADARREAARRNTTGEKTPVAPAGSTQLIGAGGGKGGKGGGKAAADPPPAVTGLGDATVAEAAVGAGAGGAGDGKTGEVKL